jgi:hypothetical protein
MYGLARDGTTSLRAGGIPENLMNSLSLLQVTITGIFSFFTILPIIKSTDMIKS